MLDNGSSPISASDGNQEGKSIGDANPQNSAPESSKHENPSPASYIERSCPSEISNPSLSSDERLEIALDVMRDALHHLEADTRRSRLHAFQLLHELEARSAGKADGRLMLLANAARAALGKYGVGDLVAFSDGSERIALAAQFVRAAVAEFGRDRRPRAELRRALEHIKIGNRRDLWQAFEALDRIEANHLLTSDAEIRRIVTAALKMQRHVAVALEKEQPSYDALGCAMDIAKAALGIEVRP
ncbi:MAG: hypothetical protein LBM75_08770 [Myxococcales bacterium]|jgi:hypothetical protein|nr:hypothetical protein [Myxococcales bacterium]